MWPITIHIKTNHELFREMKVLFKIQNHKNSIWNLHQGIHLKQETCSGRQLVGIHVMGHIVKCGVKLVNQTPRSWIGEQHFCSINQLKVEHIKWYQKRWLKSEHMAWVYQSLKSLSASHNGRPVFWWNGIHIQSGGEEKKESNTRMVQDVKILILSDWGKMRRVKDAIGSGVPVMESFSSWQLPFSWNSIMKLIKLRMVNICGSTLKPVLLFQNCIPSFLSKSETVSLNIVSLMTLILM